MFKKSKSYFLLIGIFIFSVTFFFIHRNIFFLSSYFKSYASYFLCPILVTQNKIVSPIKKFLKKRKTVAQLEFLVNDLRKENSLLLSENVALKSKQIYIKETKELIDFQKRYNVDAACCAKIIFRQNSCQENFILVDKGLIHGVKKNMVSIYKNNLVGVITEVYPWYSKVLLVTDSKCKVAVSCVKTKSEGIHTGINKKNKSIVSKINILHKPKLKDLVLSSGSGLIFPQGFALGKIASIKKRDVYYDAILKPLIDFDSIKHCLLMSRS